MELVLDTNALVYAAKNKLDIIETLRRKFGIVGVSVPNVVVDELKNLAKTAEKQSDKDAAWLAYQIVKQKKMNIINLRGPVDDAIAVYASQNGAAVLTNDLQLRTLLIERGVKIYTIRQQRNIEEW